MGPTTKAQKHCGYYDLLNQGERLGEEIADFCERSNDDDVDASDEWVNIGIVQAHEQAALKLFWRQLYESSAEFRADHSKEAFFRAVCVRRISEIFSWRAAPAGAVVSLRIAHALRLAELINTRFQGAVVGGGSTSAEPGHTDVVAQLGSAIQAVTAAQGPSPAKSLRERVKIVGPKPPPAVAAVEQVTSPGKVLYSS